MKYVARAVALAFLESAWDPEEMAARAALALGKRHRFLLPLARRLCATFAAAGVEGTAGHKGLDADALALAIREDAAFRAAWAHAKPKPHVHVWPLTSPIYGPALSWLPNATLPTWATIDEVAAELGHTVAGLGWLANPIARHQSNPRRWHYRYRWFPKRSGAWRLIEAPKLHLKDVQRRLLERVLDHVPPHDAAHGFRRAHSVVTHAAPHVGRRVVIRLDLENFFTAIGQPRVRAIFAALGYPAALARLLANLCCVATPPAVLASGRRDRARSATEHAELWAQERRLTASHLPQGAPTSPALANLAAFRLDVRLAALARSFDAHYTRYADDLVFSGERRLDRAVETFIPLAGAIASDEGFPLRWRKTRVMRSGQRQQIAGMVVNHHLQVARSERDRLEAILTNCVRHGPADQNRANVPDFRAHLEGRVSWIAMVSPERGPPLRALLAQIRWP